MNDIILPHSFQKSTRVEQKVVFFLCRNPVLATNSVLRHLSDGFAQHAIGFKRQMGSDETRHVHLADVTHFTRFVTCFIPRAQV